jgi:3-phosphoshikimate 1-carboxyvinyltransferase
MTDMQPRIQPLISRKVSGLKGRIKVPGDKSMSHRALMLGAVAIGETRIKGLLEGRGEYGKGHGGPWWDNATKKASGMPRRWRGGLQSPDHALDFGNSGTGVRLALGP